MNSSTSTCLVGLLLLLSYPQRVLTQDLFDDSNSEPAETAPMTPGDSSSNDDDFGGENGLDANGDEAASAGSDRAAADNGTAEGEDPFAGLAAEPGANSSSVGAGRGRMAAGLTVLDSPAVAAILARDLQTPSARLRAVDQLVRLGRADAAKPILEKLSGESLDDDRLSQLHQQLGTATLIRLRRAAELQPAAVEFSDRVMQAATRVATDPQRLAQWAGRLNDVEQTERFRAAKQLLRAGPHAVEPIIVAMSAAVDAKAPIRQLGPALISRLGEDAIEPLLAMREHPDHKVRAAVCLAIGQFDSPRNLVYLVRPLFAPEGDTSESQAADDAWRRLTARTDESLPAVPRRARGPFVFSAPLPDPASALELLRTEAERAYRGTAVEQRESDNQLTRWLWDAKAGRVRSVSLRADDVAMLTATRLYGDLRRLEPEQTLFARRELIGQLHVEQVLAGLESALPTGAGTVAESVRMLEASKLNELVGQALDDGHEWAALAAVRLMSESGLTEVLNPDRHGSAPLVRALSHANRRLRFEAAAAIAKSNPPASFAGAGRLADALAYFASSRGRSVVAVAHPRRAYARDVAGLFVQHGFRASIATTAAELLKVVTQSADVEYILVSDSLQDQTTWSLLEMLRANPKTARLPVVVLIRPDARQSAELLVGDQPRVITWTESIVDRDFETLIPQLLELADRDTIAAEIRQEQATKALLNARQ